MTDLQKEIGELRSFIDALKADKIAQKAKEDSERWTRWVSLTIVFLAVAAALANQQYGGFSGRAVRALNHAAIAQGNATNKWSYYQSVSIKLHMYQFEKRRNKNEAKASKKLMKTLSRAALGGEASAEKSDKPEKVDKPESGPKAVADSPKPKKAKKGKGGDKLDGKIDKYKKQKPEIMAEARKFEEEVEAQRKDSEEAQRHTKGLTLALAILQVAIAVGSISALAKKKPLWFVSMGIGAYGVFETFNGIFLWWV